MADTSTSPVVWGVNENGTREHAFVENPFFPWRSFKPRALCGMAWSPTRLPKPADAPVGRCRTCERLAAKEATDG